ncbi:uncharacterized protein SPPG_03595 [Spizellomyces punctatus DAOM BR117]|uniref:Vacuolar ATPase assembly protein VMA22 n=1 Tax=Spizellomyces punctatus (strain DAOM BR117) TaxID=645134 RepID=A0A0L0HLW2_SPIPD|nr:uncharacterized protein SPPG_03595 [Spizellomyces punctatus DAOM BR117]KND01804.1 hypothetical protein SPPG_03595 [Spizellomyces punctatus DAOM BR117]|eukprot:XP_016609843.1 hypothetical protein SPPG_03595 [Spizellomyces punctatus DAOM BR117]
MLASSDMPSITPAHRSDSLMTLLDALTEYEALRTETGQTLSKAYIDLAQAKYILGPGRLGAVAYDGRMKAGKVVHTDEKGEMFLMRGVLDTSTSLTDSDVNVSMDKEDGLRRRRAGGVKESNGTSDDEREENQDSTDDMQSADQKKPKRPTNPLNWFAPLPPTSLRSSQTHFEQVLRDLIRLSNVARRVEELRVKCEAQGVHGRQ